MNKNIINTLYDLVLSKGYKKLWQKIVFVAKNHDVRLSDICDTIERIYTNIQLNIDSQ